MTKAKAKCKCGNTAVVYAYFYNKLSGRAVHVSSCADHYKMDLKITMDITFPYKMEMIEK